MGFQFKVGETYDTGVNDDNLKLHSSSVFHYCKSMKDVNQFYACNPLSPNRFCEIEVLGAEVTDGVTCGSNRIRIVRELSREEAFRMMGYPISTFTHLVEMVENNNRSSHEDLKTPSFRKPSENLLDKSLYLYQESPEIDQVFLLKPQGEYVWIDIDKASSCDSRDIIEAMALLSYVDRISEIRERLSAMNWDMSHAAIDLGNGDWRHPLLNEEFKRIMELAQIGLIIPIVRKQDSIQLILNPDIYISPSRLDKIRQIKNKTRFYFHGIVKYNAMGFEFPIDKLWQLDTATNIVKEYTEDYGIDDAPKLSKCVLICDKVHMIVDPHILFGGRDFHVPMSLGNFADSRWADDGNGWLQSRLHYLNC